MAQTELIVALDFSEDSRAMSLIRTLRGFPLIYKVGSELFLNAGPDFVRELITDGGRVFLDLKFHDIPNTVSRAAVSAAAMGIEMFTLHLSGGREMIQAAVNELRGKRKRPKLLGVSVLTSFDDDNWNEVTSCFDAKSSKISDSVERLVTAGLKWGVDGVVCSALELERIVPKFPRLFTVVPGIRPVEGKNLKRQKNDDQARTMTPAEAAKAGAGAIVVGRPITQAKSPKDAVEKILKELKDA